MRQRRVSPVTELPLVGGVVCLDLVNTTGDRSSPAPRERLRSYEDLIVWSRRAGILSAPDAARLRRQSARRAADAARALKRMRDTREALYGVFRAVAEGDSPPPSSLRVLGRLWRADRGRRELETNRGGFVLRLRVGADELDPMRWPIVTSAVDLLLSDDLTRVKRCGECDWLFVDTSKNGSRNWCKKACGDRVRARRHYHRSDA
jgi:predicted RNA-binding Zn ribbon-like protein